MELVTEAIIFAARAHDGMRRKNSAIPYILHPMEAAAIVGTMTADQHLIAAAVLHDVVEDAGITPDEIEQQFGRRVRELVASETEDKRPHMSAAASWRIRKEESLKVLEEAGDDAVRMVWLGDKLANMRAIYRDWQVQGDQVWQHFNQKDKEAHKWYYESIARLTAALSHTAAWTEYKQLTEMVFHKGE